MRKYTGGSNEHFNCLLIHLGRWIYKWKHWKHLDYFEVDFLPDLTTMTQSSIHTHIW